MNRFISLLCTLYLTFIMSCALAQDVVEKTMIISYDTEFGPHAFLCSDHVHDSVYIIDEQGRIRWEYSIPHPQDVWMLPNGNILMSWFQGVREVTIEKETVWEFTTPRPNEIPNCQPLPDGNVMIGVVGECRLYEVDPALMQQVATGLPQEQAIVHTVQLATSVAEPHAQFRMCRKTPEGTYLVPFTAEGAIREVDAAGKILQRFADRGMPVTALRLGNGNTLINGGGLITEYDLEQNIVWQMTQEDLPGINLAIPAGMQYLPNGNIVVCNWNAADTEERIGAHLFEITPDKRIVWQVSGNCLGQVASCQLLNADLTPRTDEIIR